MSRNNDSYDHGYIFIANNLSYQNGASGIVVHKTDRAIVEHNTVYDNGTTNGEDTKPGGIGFNTVNDVTIRNNISWSKPNKFALGKVGGGNTNMSIDSNLLFNNYGPQSVVKDVSSGWFEANPGFINVSGFDFRLSETSPAIDRGITTAIVTTDFAGYPRNDGQPDIGAYEYDTSTATTEFFNIKTQQIYVYPNPVHDMLCVLLQNKSLNSLHLFDLTGKEHRLSINRESNGELLLDMSHLKRGVYILKSEAAFVKVLKR